MAAAGARPQRSEGGVQVRCVRGKPVGALPGDLDDPAHNQLCRQGSEHLWAGRLDLHQAKTSEFLHRQVDLRSRHLTFAAQRRRVGDTAQHQGYQGLPFVKGQANLFELLRIHQWHERRLSTTSSS